MKVRTKQLTMQVREALLVLPDRILLKTLMDWISLAEEHLQYPDWSDEYRYALGFRVQSLDTQTIYATFEAMNENEPDTQHARWLEPGMNVLRMIITNFSLEQFHHTLIPLAADALFERAMQERWGPPPSTHHNGYDFLYNLQRYLEARGYRRPERSMASVVPDTSILGEEQERGSEPAIDSDEVSPLNKEYPASGEGLL